ncbi:hypothetical protein M422DRAFT_277061 [Sphaerobolus stellatus SS14]|uniref:Uncharacterized protein n=1 Tax=Sphaerobolus stellatus (strain SS14) TaxID=990650 RepID=A0A0C9UBM0_SPHS4|nr:hypothetical protein M422DRAFT_277061 [Sphaerobolus stellatus SS14]
MLVAEGEEAGDWWEEIQEKEAEAVNTMNGIRRLFERRWPQVTRSEAEKEAEKALELSRAVGDVSALLIDTARKRLPDSIRMPILAIAELKCEATVNATVINDIAALRQPLETRQSSTWSQPHYEPTASAPTPATMQPMTSNTSVTPATPRMPGPRPPPTPSTSQTNAGTPRPVHHTHDTHSPVR